jgi:hypothetical protein
MTIEKGGVYTELGATTNEGSISTSGSVDTATIGVYTITYSATDGAGNTATKTRTINVLKAVPTLANTTLNVDENATSGTIVGSVTLSDEGNSSITSYELNITTPFAISASGVISVNASLSYATQSSYTFEANATNGAGTSESVTITINLNDTTPPVITLNGDAVITLEINDTYSEEGASAMDNADGNITHLIHTSGSVDTTTEGNYTITYSVSDNTGNEANISRKVNVKVAPSFKSLKKTGQTTKYVDYDDGYYQKGQEHNYTRDDSKAIVTDHVTGLMWQDNENIQKQWVTTANYNDGNYSDTSGDTATTYCNDLTLGGFNDWRLPTSTELENIVDYGRVNPSINPVFQNTSSNLYWSSATNVYNSRDAWYVGFFYGNVDYNKRKNNSYDVRCVRAGEGDLVFEVR